MMKLISGPEYRFFVNCNNDTKIIINNIIPIR